MRRGVSVRVANQLETEFGPEQIIRNIDHAGTDAKPGKVIAAIRDDWAGESSRARSIAADTTRATAAERDERARAERLAEARRIKDDQAASQRARAQAEAMLRGIDDESLADLIREALAGMDAGAARRARQRVASVGAREAAMGRTLRAAIAEVIEARRSGELRIVPVQCEGSP